MFLSVFKKKDSKATILQQIESSNEADYTIFGRNYKIVDMK